MKLRKVLAVALVVAVTIQPTALGAQGAPDDGGEPIWRRVTLAVLGGSLIGGAAGFGANENEGSLCGSKACIVGAATFIGASVGFFLGREMDQKVYRHGIEGPTMNFGLRAVDLGDTPTGVVGHGSSVVAYTRSQVGVVDSDLRFRPVLNGVQARAAATVAAEDYLVVASNDALLGVPLATSADPDAAARTLAEEGATTLEPVSESGLAVGSPGKIMIVDFDGPSSREVRSAETIGLPMSMKRSQSGEVLWTVVDSVLVSRNIENLEVQGRLELPGRTRELAVSGRTGIASLGAEGAVLLDLSNADSPRLISVIRGMEFAYSAAILNGRVYVAAGPQGIFVFDVTSPGDPRGLGVERSLGFAGTLLVHDGRLYILDRERNELNRADGLR